MTPTEIDRSQNQIPKRHFCYKKQCISLFLVSGSLWLSLALFLLYLWLTVTVTVTLAHSDAPGFFRLTLGVPLALPGAHQLTRSLPSSQHRCHSLSCPDTYTSHHQGLVCIPNISLIGASASALPQWEYLLPGRYIHLETFQSNISWSDWKISLERESGLGLTLGCGSAEKARDSGVSLKWCRCLKSDPQDILVHSPTTDHNSYPGDC